MADKGIIVEDSGTGESVACADLRENDDEGNARIVQLTSDVCIPTTPEALADGTAVRTLDFSTYGKGGGKGDDMDLQDSTTLAAIIGSVLNVSDCSAFAFCIAQTLTETENLSVVQITPVLLKTSGETKAVVGVLTPCIMPAIAPTDVLYVDGESVVANSFVKWGDSESGGTDSIMNSSGSGASNVTRISPMQVMPTLGVEYIGFHIRASKLTTSPGLASLNSNDSISVFAHALTGHYASSALAAAAHINRMGLAPWSIGDAVA